MVAELAQNRASAHIRYCHVAVAAAGQHSALANKVDVVDPVRVRSCRGSWEPVRRRGRGGPLLPLYDSESRAAVNKEEEEES